MKLRRTVAFSAAIVLGAAGCSSDTGMSGSVDNATVGSEDRGDAADSTGDVAAGQTEPVRSTVVGHADAIDAPRADEVTPKLVRLWTSVGASLPLAECYATMLEETGLSAGIEDLDDLAAAQASFSPAEAVAFGACGTGS